MWEALRADALRYQELYFPDQPPSLCSRLRLLACRGLWILATYRLSVYYRSLRQAGTTISPRLVPLALLSELGCFFRAVLTKSDVPTRVDMEPGVYLSDHGHLILGPKQVGSGCMIHQRVTIGMGLATGESPRIGRNVWIGPDCVVFGDILVGDGATLLPGSVLSKSIPAGTVVRGNPARVVARNIDNSILRRSIGTTGDELFNQQAVCAGNE